MKLILLCLLYFSFNNVDCIKSLNERKLRDVENVLIDVYFESLCPDCTKFIVNQLMPAYLAVGEVMKINLVPFGNAEYNVLPNGTIQFHCQHGPDECKINMYMACALHLIKDFNQNIRFIYCIEKFPHLKDVQLCATLSFIKFKLLENCVNSPMGEKFLKEEGDETNSLNPQHEYTPWIVINNYHNDTLNQQAQDNLIKVVCDLLKGKKPSKCNEIQQDESCLE